MTGIDIAIVAAFIAYAFWSGLSSREAASRNLEEYFLAGRTLPGWKAGISMAATQFAADTPLLVTGLIATAGIFSLWRLWIYALAFLLMGFLLAPSWRRSGVLTDAELTELRYGNAQAAVLRGVKAVYFGTVFNCTVLAWVLLAATRIAEPFLLWNEWLPPGIFSLIEEGVRWAGTPLTIAAGEGLWTRSANNFISIGAIVLVTAFYSTTGGLRSVVNTDVAQFVLAMAGTLIYAGFVAAAAGGLGALAGKLHALFAAGGVGGITATQILDFTPFQAKDATAPVLAVIAVQWLVQINADGTGYLAQRCMACRSDKDARIAAVTFTAAQILLRSLLWLPIGLGLLVLFPPDLSLPLETLKAEREATFVRGIAELLPAGIKGLMLTGMLAALASTVDTHLNWGSSYWTNDIFGRFIFRSWLKRSPSGRTMVWIARGSNILILAIALVVMTHLESIQTAWTTSLLLGAGVGVLLVLRWLWWRVNAWGEIGCLAASAILAPVLIAFVEDEAARLLLMATAATAAGVAASLSTRPEDLERLAEFYRRARPPGFWGPVAASIGEDPREAEKRLARGSAAVVLSAASFFCVLVGAGSWMCGSPPPPWFPWRSAWIASLLGAGAALVPLWFRLGFNEEEGVVG